MNSRSAARVKFNSVETATNARSSRVSRSTMGTGRIYNPAPSIIRRRTYNFTGAGSPSAGAETQKAASWRPPDDGASRARTGDLVTASHALSQLSYSPELVLDGPVYPVGLIVSRGRDAELDAEAPDDHRRRQVVAAPVVWAVGADRIDLAG